MGFYFGAVERDGRLGICDPLALYPYYYSTVSVEKPCKSSVEN